MDKNLKQNIVKTLVFFILVCTIVTSLYFFREQFQLDLLQHKLEQLGWYAPFAFILLYILATVLFLPGSVMSLLGGLLFGAYWGTLYVIFGATIGAAIAFLLGRYLAADFVTARAGNMLTKILAGVEKEGWRFVAVVRLVPLFPFNMLNYVLGVTKVNFVAYVIASFIFMIPGAFAYSYVGSLGAAAISGQPREIATKVLVALGLLVLLACIPWLVNQIRKDEKLEQDSAEKVQENE